MALITTPILTHHLGTQRFGIWIFVGSTITYVQLLDLGLGGAVVATIARLSGAADDNALEKALNTSFFLLLALGVAAMAICGLAAAFLPAVVHLRPSLAGTARDLFLLLGFDVAVSIPMDTFGCGLVALQRYDLLNASLIGVAIGQAVAWTVVLVTGGGLLLLGIVTVSISLLGQVVRFILLRRLLPTVSISFSHFERGQVRSLASSASWYALGDLIDTFLDQASVLVLGLAKGVTSAGLFAVSDKLATFGTRMGTPVTQPLFPHAATLVGRGEEGQAGRDGTRRHSRVGRNHGSVLPHRGALRPPRFDRLGRTVVRTGRARRDDLGGGLRAAVLRHRPHCPAQWRRRSANDRHVGVGEDHAPGRSDCHPRRLLWRHGGGRRDSRHGRGRGRRLDDARDHQTLGDARRSGGLAGRPDTRVRLRRRRSASAGTWRRAPCSAS